MQVKQMYESRAYTEKCIESDQMVGRCKSQSMRKHMYLVEDCLANPQTPDKWIRYADCYFLLGTKGYS